MADEIQAELARLSDTVRRQAERARVPVAQVPVVPPPGADIAAAAPPDAGLLLGEQPWYKSDWIWILVVVVIITLVLLYVWWKRRSGGKDKK